MLCAVIDTNVLVSAALAKRPDASIPSRVVECAFEGAYTPLFSAAIVAEYSEVLSRPKFKIDERKRRMLLDAFVACGVFVDAPPTGVSLPDPKDVMFHDVAVAQRDAGAVIVTGNKRHFPKCSFALSPREFLRLVEENGPCAADALNQ